MTDCYCDYEPARIYSSRVQRARKEYICEECGAKIPPGEQYERAFGVWDFASEFMTCERCLNLRQWVTNSVPCFCWAHGNMIEDAKETVDSAWYRAGDEALGLRFGFLRKLYSVRRRP